MRKGDVIMKEYNEPKLEIIEFESEDVITNSTELPGI